MPLSKKALTDTEVLVIPVRPMLSAIFLKRCATSGWYCCNSSSVKKGKGNNSSVFSFSSPVSVTSGISGKKYFPLLPANLN